MITPQEVSVLLMCVEGFLYGLYSGIFAMYLQCPSKESRTAIIIFFVLCLLYVLSTASFVCDLLAMVLLVRNSTPQLQIDSQTMLFHLTIVQSTLNGCCDFIAQCTLIYRCWIVWGKNIHIVIVPSFLAITYIATWLASIAALTFEYGEPFTALWGVTLILTGLAASMVVNALATGLIVFKILKVFLKVKPTSVEKTLGSLSPTGGTKLQHIIFIIIESGMALFAIQLVRVVITSLVEFKAEHSPQMPPGIIIALDLTMGIHEMLNGIAPTIIFVRASMRLSLNDESFKEAVGSLHFNNLPSDPNSFQRVGSCSSMPPQEKNEDEDLCFNNPPSDPNIVLQVRRVGSSSTPLQDQERSEDT